MNVSPPSLDPRLESLQREIRARLQEVRRRLDELEEVERQTRAAAAPPDFAELLREALSRRGGNAA